MVHACPPAQGGTPSGRPWMAQNGLWRRGHRRSDAPSHKVREVARFLCDNVVLDRTTKRSPLGEISTQCRLVAVTWWGRVGERVSQLVTGVLARGSGLPTCVNAESRRTPGITTIDDIAIHWRRSTDMHPGREFCG